MRTAARSGDNCLGSCVMTRGPRTGTMPTISPRSNWLTSGTRSTEPQHPNPLRALEDQGPLVLRVYWLRMVTPRGIWLHQAVLQRRSHPLELFNKIFLSVGNTLSFFWCLKIFLSVGNTLSFFCLSPTFQTYFYPHSGSVFSNRVLKTISPALGPLVRQQLGGQCGPVLAGERLPSPASSVRAPPVRSLDGT